MKRRLWILAMALITLGLASQGPAKADLKYNECEGPCHTTTECEDRGGGSCWCDHMLPIPSCRII